MVFPHRFENMSQFRNMLRNIKNSSVLLRRIHAKLAGLRHPKDTASASSGTSYLARLRAETAAYKDVVDINVLPAIFHYWSHTYVRAMFEDYGFSNPDQFFAKYMQEAAVRCENQDPRFISLGAGNCDTEVRLATLLKAAGLQSFVIECLDVNPYMLARGVEAAQQAGVGAHIRIVEGDFNQWQPSGFYAAVIANQSLHHMLELERVFTRVQSALLPRGLFLVSDMIGRNGHLRWPEALKAVDEFWKELPSSYHFNQQLKRQEDKFSNWDCSAHGFEGIRAKDILPLLIEHFHFKLFVAFGNVIDPFTDRAFGHNFNGDGEWDRDFIDRVHAWDEKALSEKRITPTHLVAVLTKEKEGEPMLSRGLLPIDCVRRS